MGWQRRWISDDGFIHLRWVRQVLEGNGPVFNAGERIEQTSPIWLWLLVIGDVVLPIRLEWIAVLGALGAGTLGLGLAIAGTARLVRISAGDTAPVLVPLGAAVFVALPPVWDFATSGLENGIGILWIGASWYALTKVLARERSETLRPDRPWWLLVLLGLGPLIRPDMGVLAAVWLVVWLMIASNATWWLRARAVGLALAVPIAYQIFRMAYYGVLVPNPAMAKESTRSWWLQGLKYLIDLFSPYWLLVPLLLLAAVFLAPMVTHLVRSKSRGARLLVLGTLTGGLLHGIYIVRVGGDFMHGRLLLPALLTVLLPVLVVTVQKRQIAIAIAVSVWIGVCALSLRLPYQGIGPRGIADHRADYVLLTGNEHPVTADAFLKDNWSWSLAGRAVRVMAQQGDRGLILDMAHPERRIPLRRGIPARIVVVFPALGIFSYEAGTDVTVIDPIGLSNALGSHIELGDTRGRPGHEKHLPNAWIVASFARPGAELPPGVSPANVRAARRALQCGGLRELTDSVEDSITLGRFLENLTDALGNTTLRIPSDPKVAARELCS